MRTYLFAVLLTFSSVGIATAETDAGPAAVEPAVPSEAAPTAVAPGAPAIAVEGAPASTQPSPPAAAPAPADKPAPDPSDDIMAGIKLAFQYGGWVAVLGFLLAVVFTRFSRPGAAYFVKWFGTRWGGYAWAVLSAMGLTIGGALAIGTGWSLGLLGTGVAAALASIAVHQGAKDVKEE